MNQKFKRILSLFLSLLMGMSALPAYAAPEQAADQSSTTSQTAETNTETNKTAAEAENLCKRFDYRRRRAGSVQHGRV